MQQQDIIDYLNQHPDFFRDHLDLLQKMYIPHGTKGTLSLVEMQLEQQRQRIAELEFILDKFAQLAQQDQAIFLGLMPLQKKLSQTEHFVDGVAVLNQWIKKFELQQAKLLLFTDQWQKNADVPAQYWLDRNAFELIRLERLGLRRFYLGELTNKEKSLLFLPEELPVGSVACCLLGVRENQHKANALLLFSARDTRHFYNGQDTAFLQHLLDIVELHLQRWLLGKAK